MSAETPPRILIIAGSDSSGGAGIQADIKTVTMMGGYAMTAITAVTAQNTAGVTRVDMLSADSVTAQVEACLSDIGADAVKTGMIGSAAQVEAIASALGNRAVPLVLDPVMVATSGARLIDEATLAALREYLFPRAALLTPNLDELAVLADREIGDSKTMEAEAKKLSARLGCAVLAKGGHLPGDALTDILVEGSAVWRFPGSRIDTSETHGTGCTLASAIATGLGRGLTLPDAVGEARLFVRAAIAAAPGFGAGGGPLGHQAVTRPDHC
ncbi:bifunctional hydroxymethylpyrimidine kinase/phosphomethylpyrimidine kinase [Pacificimonas flava]|uniref:hydroxymethylpyrimidine kinase n=2 Tax=Pacificimonas TaxID=1960290 RepID=A0A219B1M5_9SPHN|nr:MULTISPECIES: bifunctional hydroxymethylpyrimidine kinase/phosphomethylpyrimidine kinase [Pacificimonas]MBZ6378115.1 bifunctional hydroxymethylpyrimidine kinase/phosphomethylpyrimidine kinase [Pacificimonas aurantium]OWV32247.1 bifunctional hydroxymethylpyrimidine kinase/phosphomethylpyrimidine kinase [Pacificimonas flava]